MKDAYKSIYEALVHAGIENDARINVVKIDSEDCAGKTAGALAAMFKGVEGILIPGGFGKRGVEGKIKAIEFARSNHIPFLGLCLGVQAAIIEFARHVCHMKNAHSTEFNKHTTYPVVSLLEEQKNMQAKGATMRLGAYPCRLKKHSKSYNAYRSSIITERHRHRYEFNNLYRKIMEKKGMVFAGVSPDRRLVEIIELKNHPWFVAVQFHPEFKSKPIKAHPLFRDFIKAALVK